VRTPTPAPEQLALWASDPWPTWREGRGELTEHGKRLATLMGRYYRDYVAAQGIVSAGGCPKRGDVYVYADLLQRTKVTAQGFIDGLAPGCHEDFQYRKNGDIDPLFHPVDGGVCKLDAVAAQTAVLARVDGNFANVLDRQREALSVLQSTLRSPKPSLCAASALAAGCSLEQLPTALVTASNGKSVNLSGALAIASTVSEIFLLEYTDARPASEVAWGRADLPRIQQMLALHDAAFDLTQRTPYLARLLGSALLSRVAATLTGRTVAGVTPDPAERDARVAIYVGHDTNLANLGGMLDASWALPGWQVNETPPAGAMIFELRETRDGEQRIYVSFAAQSAEQMRNATPLTLDNPPQRVPIRIAACSANATDSGCSVDGFVNAVASAVMPSCVASP